MSYLRGNEKNKIHVENANILSKLYSKYTKSLIINLLRIRSVYTILSQNVKFLTERYGSMLLTSTCKINYVDIQHDY